MQNKKHLMLIFSRVVLSLFICCMATSCSTSSDAIAYHVADHYFLNNNVKKMPAPKIATTNEFNKLFGCAPVMGKNGMPTNIDFSKEYVIAVCKPETDISTELAPVSLTKDAGGNIVFTYKTTVGQKQTYTIVPCLLIVVDKKNEGPVVLKEIIAHKK